MQANANLRISARFLSDTTSLSSCRCTLIWHDIKMWQKMSATIVCSTLGRSTTFNPTPSNLSFYKKKVGFNAKVNKGTFCYKCLCPTPWEKNKSYGICVLYRPQGLAFCPGSFNGNSITIYLIIHSSWGLLTTQESKFWSTTLWLVICQNPVHNTWGIQQWQSLRLRNNTDNSHIPIRLARTLTKNLFIFCLRKLVWGMF